MPLLDQTTSAPIPAKLRRRFALALATAAVIFLFLASAASAKDRVYWSNLFGDSIAYANLDGSGGGTLPIDPAALNGPMGLAVDTAAGKLYWANYGVGPNVAEGTTLGVANIDGSGAHIVPIGGGLVSGPHGVAVDSAANRLYWTNRQDQPPNNSWIGVSALDGSGASILNTGEADMEGPRGLALDKPNKRIFWANFLGNTISYASTDGGSGGDLNTGGATVNNPEGVALDGAGRLFFSNFSTADKISYLYLNGSGGADLDTSPIASDEPHGVAIDPGAGRVYYPNFTGNTIASANLGGGGGAFVNTAGAAVDGPDLPILIETPVADGLASVKGDSAPKSKLTCKDNFRPDLLTALLYRAPQSRSYAWLKNGKAIPGETSSTLTVQKVGDYSCLITGQNSAGSATETSEMAAIFKLGHVKVDPDTGTAKLLATLPGPGTLTLRGKKVVKQRPGLARVGYGASLRKVKGHHTKLLIKPKGKAKRKLLRTGKVKVKVLIDYLQKGGGSGQQTRVVRLKLR